ncbi:MAG: hypothetical protein KGR98_06050 [Verrucomicrobia bacterium]|nr:hypothetical protein [Verrucomicrobiota bacterium]MDE3099539.1 hypothetical protein [Verrucomicrobiota bacterium]
MKIEDRRQFLVILTIAAAALFLADHLLYEPAAAWWSGRAQTIAQLRQKVTAGNLLLRRETVIRNRWKEMNDGSLPNSQSQAEQRLLKALDDWSRNSGANVTAIAPQWQNDAATNYATLNCRVEASGDLGTLCQFLDRLETGSMALKLDSMDLSSGDGNGRQFTLALEVNGLAIGSQTTQ